MKGSDRISNLPENITENILNKLPIRDAVRTSILSRYWRYIWTTLPDLVFDVEGVDHSTFYMNAPGPIFDDWIIMGEINQLHETFNENKLVRVIYSILCQHKGPVHKFSLSCKNMIVFRDIDQWLIFLSRNGIKEFFLEFNKKSQYKVHSSLFSFIDLRQLRLHGCTIPTPPSIFNGFNDLFCLKLDYVTVNNETFDKMIAKCLQLKILFLLGVKGLDRLHIDHSPKLKALYFKGSLIYICLNNSPSLSWAKFSFSQLPAMTEENLGGVGSISMISNLNCLSNLRKFVARFYFLKFIAEDSVRKSLPSTFNHLHRVKFSQLMFEDISSLSSVLALIRSSPNLEALEVKACRTIKPSSDQLNRATEYLEEESYTINTCLMKLRNVEMKELLGVGPERELIKLILGNSPSLEEMQIVLRPDETDAGFKDRELQMLKNLIQFPRASKIAQVIYEGQVQNQRN